MKVKEPGMVLALIPLIVLIGAAAMSIFIWDEGMFIPLISGIAAACFIGKMLGYKWAELQEHLVAGVGKALPAVFILFLIGTIIGTWILSGIIPMLIYYGLAMIHPRF